IQGTGPGGKITKEDVQSKAPAARVPVASEPSTDLAPKPEARPLAPTVSGDGIKRVPMSKIRKRIAENLLRAQQTAAILTTFNEADMTNIMPLRVKYKER